MSYFSIQTTIRLQNYTKKVKEKFKKNEIFQSTYKL